MYERHACTDEIEPSCPFVARQSKRTTIILTQQSTLYSVRLSHISNACVHNENEMHASCNAMNNSQQRRISFPELNNHND